MNYVQIYNKLILRAQGRVLEGYSERHHILPRCIGGTNEKDNIVRLTPEEHYLAHQLLVKIYPGQKGLLFACFVMCNKAEQRSNNKIYGWLRRLQGEAKRGIKASEETRAKMSASRRGKTKSEAHRVAIANALKGKKHSAERKIAVSIGTKIGMAKAIASGKKVGMAAIVERNKS
jgi:hypothetical protein